MQSSAHIEDIINTLFDSRKFIVRLLENFSTYGFDRENAVIRIGVSGTGRFPNYCIQEGCGERSVKILHEVVLRGYAKREVFHGQSHNSIFQDRFMGSSWSSVEMTFREVRSILAKLGTSAVVH